MPNVNVNRLDHYRRVCAHYLSQFDDRVCAQVGPRGGRCRRKAEIANGWPLDFCAKHNQMVRDGHTLQCRKCGTTASMPRIGE